MNTEINTKKPKDYSKLMDRNSKVLTAATGLKDITGRNIRKILTKLCSDAIVCQQDWDDRDSEKAQKGVGRCWQLLSCGCPFKIITFEDIRDQYGDEKARKMGGYTDRDYIHLLFKVHSFMWKEMFDDEDDQDKSEWADGLDIDSDGDFLSFYIPTRHRLDKAKGKDWYTLD